MNKYEVIAELETFMKAYSTMGGLHQEMVYTCASVEGVGQIKISTLKRVVELLKEAE